MRSMVRPSNCTFLAAFAAAHIFDKEPDLIFGFLAAFAAAHDQLKRNRIAGYFLAAFAAAH